MFITPSSIAINLKKATPICTIFPDMGFAETVARHLGKSSIDESVSQKELNRITTLSQIGVQKISQKIVSIEGIQYLNNLKIFSVGGNQISDLSPLKDLKSLCEVSLPFNQITDLTPLSSLTNLQRINLSYNQIIDLEPLEYLSSLYALEIKSNYINNLTPISKLKELRTLDITGNCIRELWPLLCLEKLKDLWLYPRQLESIHLL